MFRSIATAATAALTVAVMAAPASAQSARQTADQSGYTQTDQGWRDGGWRGNSWSDYGMANRGWNRVGWNNGGWNNGGWNNGWRDSNAFWPGEVAAGVVGGAMGTAGAIAAAPFGGLDGGYYYPGYRGQTYAQRNGFVCTPGGLTRMEDGLLHRCQ